MIDNRRGLNEFASSGKTNPPGSLVLLSTKESVDRSQRVVVIRIYSRTQIRNYLIDGDYLLHVLRDVAIAWLATD